MTRRVARRGLWPGLTLRAPALRAPALWAPALWTLVACGPSAEECRDPGRAEPCESLSSYGFFQGALSLLQPAARVVPYEPTTPLFSDYASKQRFAYVPAGAQARYTDQGVFELPLGSVVIKSFAFPRDLQKPALGQRIVETRLLIRRTTGWDALPYLWNADQTEATLRKIGATVPVTWTHTDGTQRSNDYVVPNTNMCKECHESDSVSMKLIGVKAALLNRDYPYDSGAENQLLRWTRTGLLSGAPAPAAAPKMPVWDDPATGTLDQRARAWLDVNCAHCHDGAGMGSTSGLDLRYEQRDPAKFGVCKSPVAAGTGTGMRKYDLLPGQPDQSILQYRIESTTPKVMMPETGRRLAHAEGIALVREWIQEMTWPQGALTSCD